MPGQNFDETIISSGNNPFNIKLLVGFIVILLLAGVGMGYYLYNKGAIDLPFPPSSKQNQVSNNQPTLEANPSSRIENCTVQKGLDSMVWDILKPAPGVLEVDYRGKIASITPNGDTTLIKLTALDGTYVHEFSVNNTEIIYGKSEQAVSDLKNFDEIMIIINCVPEKRESFRISRIYRIEDQ